MRTCAKLNETSCQNFVKIFSNLRSGIYKNIIYSSLALFHLSGILFTFENLIFLMFFCVFVFSGTKALVKVLDECFCCSCDPKIFRSAPSCFCCCLKLFTNKWLSDFVLFIVYPTLESVKNSRE